MMRTLTRVILAGGLLSFSGCIPSLHPLYTENDIVFDGGLVGEWSEDNARDTWTFAASSTNRYSLVHIDRNGNPGRFDVVLAEIGGHLFLNFFPETPTDLKNLFYRYHLLSIHTFAHVQQIEPTLQMRFPDPEWLEEHLKEHPDEIRHEVVGDGIILSATTEDMQTFWLQHLSTDGAFGDASNMKRLASRSPIDESIDAVEQRSLAPYVSPAYTE